MMILVQQAYAKTKNKCEQLLTSYRLCRRKRISMKYMQVHSSVLASYTWPQVRPIG